MARKPELPPSPIVLKSRFPEDAIDRDIKRMLPEPIDIRDLLDADLPRPPELVEGILHKGSKMVIGGGSKSFKTWSLLDLAMSVAAGVPWWGFPTTHGRVLYINFEVQDPFFKERVEQIAEAKVCCPDCGQFLYLGLRGQASRFPSLTESFIERFAGAGLSLMVIDPIYKLLGDRDENKAGDITGMLNDLEHLAVETGAAVVFGHHFSKGNQAGKESIDRIGGSGVFARDPDTILTMTRHQEDDAFTVEATLRNFPPMEPFVVERRHPLMIRNDELNPKELKQAGPSKQKYTDDQLLESLAEGGMTATEWQRDAENRIGIKERMFYTRKSELAIKGLVREEGKEWVAVANPKAGGASVTCS